MKIVLLCGRQGFALRGHQDDGIFEEDNNINFNALSEEQIDAGDTVLETHLKTCDLTAT